MSQALAEELSEAEQSSAKQYGDTAEFLARHYVLKHKDKGVRLYAACCLVDILRIYAPEAPFNQDQMWEVFSLIISQLRGLEHGPNGLNIKKHFYILESIALVRSFTVCLELDFQDLILQLFKLFFSVVKESHSVKVLNLMVEVMSPIIEDSESIPQELLDTVLINLIEPIKSQNPSAYRIASNLVEKTSSSIEPFIQMFFNSVLTLGKTSESDLTDRVYDLILELNRIAPLVLLSVLPQLEFKLKSPDVEDRLAVTRLLSQMFSDQSSELAIQNKSLWQSYLGRYLDINVDVRVECVKNAKHFLILNNELSSEVSEKLRSRSKDPDDKVRQEVVTGTCEAASQNIDCVSDKLFEDICERMRDKKSNVRMEAMICIGKLYKKYTTGATADLSAAKRLSWVPNKLLVWYYQPSIEDQLCVERLLSGCLVPVSLPAEERVKRLLSLYTRLDEHAVGALRMVFKCQANVRSDLAALVQLVGEEKSNDTDKMIMSHIITLARTLPNPFKSQENLKKLPEMLKEEKTRALLSTCVNPNVGCPAVFKAVSEFVVKLGARNPILDTMKAMLDRAAPVLVDAECIRILLTQVKNLIEGLEHDEEEEEDLDESTDSPSNRGTKGLDLLVTLSSVFPSHFQNEESFELLLVFLKHHDPQLVSLALQILSNTVEEMQSTAESLISYYQPVLSNLATKGTPRHAKFAIRSLAKIFKDPINVFERIFSNIVSSLDYDHPMLLTYLTSLAELAVLVPSLFETKQKFIIRDFVVKELLVKDRVNQNMFTRLQNTSHIEAVFFIKGIKVMVRWLEGLQSNHKNSGLPVLRLLHTVLVHAGDLQNNNCVCPHDCSRLRLAAACGMLKIAKELNYEEVVSLEHYQQLALTIQVNKTSQ
ncbi:predicted protein [Nematostella vectensis]|uniref:Uncharacterized protein n=1 Tax=Nematostella vectensis TaxID=45351 RepID=A7RFN5_NEMVE|nr:predicted protein [Nematostella vectensis]|eukprot:XP_001641695.1 predicted protein [Nematostella vectensis]